MTTAENDLHGRFDAWLRGELTAEAESIFLSEAAADPVLSAEVESYRDLVARLRALPAAAEPEVDLWPGIAARLPARARMPGLSFPAGRRFAAIGASGASGASGAIAAALLLAVLATAAWRASRHRPVEAEVAPVPGTGVALAAYAETDQALGEIRDELRRAIEARQEKLPPETRALVFDNLRTIDRAIAEIEAALQSAPADPELARTYISYRERQIDLLRQANRIAARL